MVKKYRMSITPRGTLTDMVETVFRGRGDSINISDKDYTLREYGGLSKHNPVRLSMLGGLENWARINPGVRCIIKVELGNENKKQPEPTLKVRFTRAREISKAEKDSGTHQYAVVEGTHYKVEIKGNLKVMGRSVDEIMQDGRQIILAYQRDYGKLPDCFDIDKTLQREIRIGPFRFKRKY